jgi:6-pyruvoyl-tetrahydropterin synthase
MYSITVRDHVMIAHSFKGDLFGPARRLHGATYVIDVELRRSALEPEGIVVDIGRAAEALRHILAALNYRNLDEMPALAGRNTTTEVLAKFVFDAVVSGLRRGDLGPGGAHVEELRVTLHESHLASGSYEGRVREG